MNKIKVQEHILKYITNDASNEHNHNIKARNAKSKPKRKSEPHLKRKWKHNKTVKPWYKTELNLK